MRRLVRQFARFSLVGVSAFLIDYLGLMLLSQALGWDPVPAAAVSFLVSLVYNYLLSMRFVFTRRPDLSRGRELLAFCALSGVGLALNELIIWAGVSLLGSGPVEVSAVKVVSGAIVSLWNFWSRRRWLDAGSRG